MKEIYPTIERDECDICGKSDVPCWKLYEENGYVAIYLCLDCLKIAVRALEELP